MNFFEARWLPMATGIVLMATVGVVGIRTATGQQQVTAKLGIGAPQGSEIELAAKQFEAALSGRLRVTIFPGFQLGQAHHLIEQVQTGALSLAIISSAALERTAPGLALVHSPFVFESHNELEEFQRGSIGQELLARLRERGMAALSYWTTGYYHLWGKQSITGPSQLHSARIALSGPSDGRTPRVFEQLNATSIRLANADLNKIDVAEATLQQGKTLKLNERFATLTLTAHRPQVYILIANPTFMKALTPELDKQIRTAASTLGNELLTGLSKREQDAINSLPGVEISRPTNSDMEALRRLWVRLDPAPGPSCASDSQRCKEGSKCVCSTSTSCTKC